MRYTMDLRRNQQSAGIKVVPDDPFYSLSVEFRGPGAREAASAYLAWLTGSDTSADVVVENPEPDEAVTVQ